jgi:hypothetical protein
MIHHPRFRLPFLFAMLASGFITLHFLMMGAWFWFFWMAVVTAVFFEYTKELFRKGRE